MRCVKLAKISAKKLIKKINREYVPYGYLDKRPEEIYNEGYNAGLDRIAKIIKGMEAKAIKKDKTDNKVKQGKWIINSDGYYPYCSCCKEEPESKVMTKYCPNCGAKMDKE